MTAHTFKSLISCDLYSSFSPWNLLMPVSHERSKPPDSFGWQSICSSKGVPDNQSTLSLFEGTRYPRFTSHHIASHFTANAWDTKGSSMCSSLHSDSSWDRENEWIYNCWHTNLTVNLRENKPLKSSLISRDSCSHASSHRHLAMNWQEL